MVLFGGLRQLFPVNRYLKKMNWGGARMSCRALSVDVQSRQRPAAGFGEDNAADDVLQALLQLGL